MDFLKQINPIVEKFIGELKQLEDNLFKQSNQLEERLKKNAEQGESLRQLEKQHKDTLRIKSQKLDVELNRQKDIQTDLQKEMSRTNRLNNELEFTKNKVAQTLENTEAERNLAVEVRRKQDDKLKEYNNKIILLREDFDKLKAGQVELAERIRKVKTRELAATKSEDKLIKWEGELGTREVNIKTKEKRLEFEAKKLKLNE